MAAILDWAEHRHDQSISESDIRQIAVQAASIESPEKQGRTIEKSHQSNVHESGDGHTNADALAKTEGKKESEKGKVQTQVRWSLLLCARAVIRGVTVERKLLEGQEQPGRRQLRAGKAEMRAARAVKELCPLRSGRILMKK